eukprot:Opistho-2@63401
MPCDECNDVLDGGVLLPEDTVCAPFFKSDDLQYGAVPTKNEAAFWANINTMTTFQLSTADSVRTCRSNCQALGNGCVTMTYMATGINQRPYCIIGTDDFVSSPERRIGGVQVVSIYARQTVVDVSIVNS